MRKREGVVGSMSEWTESRPNTRAVDLTEIDPEGEVILAAKVNVERITCTSLTEWVTEGHQRRKSEHTLHPADSPRNMMVGFVDEDTNQEIRLPVRVLKAAEDSEYEALGITREQVASVEGRVTLFGMDRFFLPGRTVHEPDPKLEQAWTHLQRERSNDA
jgi:hypothetical protein